MKCETFSGRGVQGRVNKFLEGLPKDAVKDIKQSTAIAKFDYTSVTVLTITIFYEEE